MTHVRTQIRDAAVTTLTGLTTTGARVYPSRLTPLRDADLPCLLVMTNDEEIAGADVHGVLQERTLRLAVRAVAKVSGALDDTLDAMVAEVETALYAQTFGGLAKSVNLAAISIEMEDALEKQAGFAELAYTVTYYTAAGSPGTAL